MQIRQLFLFGGRAANFEVTSKAFIDAAGGAQARIALLFPSGDAGWDRNLHWYCDPWLGMGVDEVTPIYPIKDKSFISTSACEDLKRSTGIFMCGGDTRKFHRVYMKGLAKQIIKQAYKSGVPYGGLSAGALLVPHRCLIWGDRMSSETNELRLRGSEDGCCEELLLGQGFGFLKGLIIETHFSERGGFSRLLAAMEKAGTPLGIGLDDRILLHLTDETAIRVEGIGRAYLFRQVEERHFETIILEPGQELSLADIWKQIGR